MPRKNSRVEKQGETFNFPCNSAVLLSKKKKKKKKKRFESYVNYKKNYRLFIKRKGKFLKFFAFFTDHVFPSSLFHGSSYDPSFNCSNFLFF